MRFVTEKESYLSSGSRGDELFSQNDWGIVMELNELTELTPPGSSDVGI